MKRSVETPIMFAIRAAIAGRAMVHRNNTGFDADAKVRYGLGRGGPDLVAIARGRFLGLEVKAPGGRLSDDQKLWHAAARRHGALIAVVQTVDEAVAAYERALVGAPNWEHFE